MTTPSLISTTDLEKQVWTWQGHKIQYTVQGEGPPLLLIHGFGASIGHWRKNIPVLANGGYRVFAIDLLGFGNSDKPACDYTLDLWQELVQDFWTAKIQAPTVFIGNSIGALLSLMLATHLPEITAGVGLINAAGGLNNRPEELNLPLRWLMGTFTTLVSSPLTSQFIFNRIRQKGRIRNTLYQVYYDRKAVTEELVEMLYRPSEDPGAQQVFASILTAPAGPKPKDLLPHLKRPLLVLWGEKDPWTPLSMAGIYQELSENSDRVTFHSIPNAGHCPHDENPQQINEQLLNWLNGITVGCYREEGVG